MIIFNWRSFLKDTFIGYRLLSRQLLLFSTWKVLSLSSVLYDFWKEIFVFVVFPKEVRFCFFRIAFKCVFVPLASEVFAMIFLGVHFFGFTLFVIHACSWISRYMSLAKFWKFSSVISLRSVLALLSFSFPNEFLFSAL